MADSGDDHSYERVYRAVLELECFLCFDTPFSPYNIGIAI